MLINFLYILTQETTPKIHYGRNLTYTLHSVTFIQGFDFNIKNKERGQKKKK